MNDLHIPASQSTPEIRTDSAAGTLLMRGDSYPENSFELFSPLLGWVQRYLAETVQPLVLNLHLLYLNTSSVKVMMEIFDNLEEAHAGGRTVSVNWHYDQENERVAELAEEFKEDCSFPFNIVQQ
ncbi:protein of unknown function [Andreprevotia lacus DSM 23236]|jgi:hypothetical protein|uniref:SiaC family regulatory phosphoprotein domain-containing protein n=1 Tax=Andreprevotia lacus DSM 23236 TaxID=1121001 RepID=A0A1W1X6Q6_9NEIS|nr:biofilm regulation phosphoprotein SiaC [Andreprevotia lacus]SMC19161.1 protein of unknown function [Andreprevotia lacus DSM 23236]